MILNTDFENDSVNWFRKIILKTDVEKWFWTLILKTDFETLFWKVFAELFPVFFAAEEGSVACLVLGTESSSGNKLRQ
jgi:hypothetical protein